MEESTRTAAHFALGEIVVYPAHGVGKVTSIETARIGGHEVKLLVITFDRDRMTLRVPFHKLKTSRLRTISTAETMEAAMATLKEPATPSKIMWSRRAEAYMTKINSGDPVMIAEVLRDLRCDGAREQSHSERLLHEEALARLAQEVAAVEDTKIEAASSKLKLLLSAA